MIEALATPLAWVICTAIVCRTADAHLRAWKSRNDLGTLFVNYTKMNDAAVHALSIGVAHAQADIDAQRDRFDLHEAEELKLS